MDSSVLGFYVAYEHSAKDAQGLAGIVPSRPYPGTKRQTRQVRFLRFSESTRLHLHLISLTEADVVGARARAKSLSITPTRCVTVGTFPALSGL